MSGSATDFLGTVTVIGGGIAGLTAAQALAERGFKVYVAEPARGLGPTPGSAELRLGGMASSQYSEPDRIHRFRPDARDLPRGIRLPGEHGFRFFPAYYHNVWDTMQAIPLYRDGEPSGSTVYDNLVPCLGEAAVGLGVRPLILPQLRARTLAELLDEVGQLYSEGMTPQDLQAYLSRMLRYMCTCSERRAADCQDMSFLQYLQGWNSPTNRAPVSYSERFLQEVRKMPKVLAAFDARYGDARTELNTSVQLLRNLVADQPKVDGVLNGPTTEAWFVPWRIHLARLGVELVEAGLERLYLDETGELRARFSSYRDGAMTRRISASDYFVLATDVVTAQAVTEDLPEIGVAGGLRGYASSVPPDPLTGEGAIPYRDPLTEAGRVPWDRLQTGTGIQFFFREKVGMVSGHLYFGGSPWGLTSIMEQNFWVDPPTLERDGFQAVLSVDVFAWNTPGLAGHPPANQSSRHEIAHEVWRQIKAGVPSKARDELPEPDWYTLDHNLLFARSDADPEPVVDGDGPPAMNLTPYLVPLAKDWQRRPGAEPWDPTSGTTARRFEPFEDGLWQAGHGGYLVHWNRLVFAGVYTRTFTRMTTMESACESGRHAVNAILDHVLFVRSGGTDPRDQTGQAWNVPVGFTTRLHGAPVMQPTPIGDYCNIWNIEHHEIPDFRTAKLVDRWLFEHGLPHIWEALGWDQLTSIGSFVGRLSGLSSLATILADAGKGGTGLDPAASLRVLQDFRERLEEMANSWGQK